MKTKIYIFSLLGCLLLTMGACLSDGKDDYLDEYTSFLCILNSNEQDVTFYNTGETATYDITIDKGGYNLNMAASAVLKVLSEFDVEAYNNENKTNFKQLPAECYELPTDMSVSFGEKDLYQVKTVTFHPEKFSGLSADGFTHVLMMELTEGTSPINAKNKYVIVKPTVYQPELSLAETGFKLPFVITQGVTEYTYELPVTLSTPLPEDMTCAVTVKESLLDDYNSENGVDYKLMTTGYTIGTLTIAKGNTTANLTVKVDITNLEGDFALPLEITSKYSFIGGNTIIIGLKNSIPKIALTSDMMTLTGTELSGATNFDAWLDGNTGSFAEVLYAAASKPFPHQLDIKLNAAISKLKVRYATRNSAMSHPTAFSIYVGTSESDLIKIKDFTLADGLPTAAATYYENCPIMDLGNSYTYVRFEVTASNNANKKTTWGLSEFELYGK